VALQEKYGALDAKFIMNDDKFICLTFDEGYENGYTPAILDTLKEKGVKAIFFVTYDFAKSNPELIERMIDEGHIIGNHSYRHYTLDEVSTEEATEEIVYLDNYMKETFQYRMTLFRFPKGEFSENTLALADSLGYKSVFWSFAYTDWDTENPTDKDEAYQTITDNFHNGEIMLLHAVSQTNAEILGSVIDEAINQGYTFTTEV
jgi:peptidoglycan-N-acetylmuramic acid deacetylase